MLIPISKQLNNNFLEYKKAEAKFNIKSNEFGQKFADWLVYIEHSDDTKRYSGVTLYQAPTAKGNEKLILSSTATINNEKGVLSLNLDQGKVFEFSKDTIQQINFEAMHINARPKTPIGAMQSIAEYWSGVLTDTRRAYDLSFFLLIALFPIASTLIALSIGLVTYRYNKSGIYISMFATISIYLVLTTLISTWQPQMAPLIVFILTFSIAYSIYQKRIRAVF